MSVKEARGSVVYISFIMFREGQTDVMQEPTKLRRSGRADARDVLND